MIYLVVFFIVVVKFIEVYCLYDVLLFLHDHYNYVSVMSKFPNRLVHGPKLRINAFHMSNCSYIIIVKHVGTLFFSFMYFYLLYHAHKVNPILAHTLTL